MIRLNDTLQIAYGDETHLAQLCTGYNRGFSDYKYSNTFDLDGLQRFLVRSGIDLASCAVLLAHEQGSWQGAGVALLAMVGAEAWCGGLAVAPEHRRQGAAEALMVAVQQRAGQNGITSLRLEVLSENERARRLYRRLGYREERELLIWERSSRQGPLPLPYERLQTIDPTVILDEMHDWHDLTPAWQRRAHFLRRAASTLEGYFIPARDGLPVAYALCLHNAHGRSGETVHLLDIAVDPDADTIEAGRPLIQALQLAYPDATLLLVNEPVDSKLNRIFAALGFVVADRQYEMVLDLAES